MSEITPPQAHHQASNAKKLLGILQRILPLVNGITRKLRWAMFMGIGVVIWIAIWLVLIKQVSWLTAGIVLFIVILPVLVVMRFWWSFEELKALPDILNTMISDTQSNLSDTVAQIRAGEGKKLGLLGSAKGLWSVGSVLSEARDLFGSYVSIATLVNPVSLVLGVVSLLAIAVLFLIGLVLAFWAW